MPELESYFFNPETKSAGHFTHWLQSKDEVSYKYDVSKLFCNCKWVKLLKNICFI